MFERAEFFQQFGSELKRFKACVWRRQQRTPIQVAGRERTVRQRDRKERNFRRRAVIEQFGMRLEHFVKRGETRKIGNELLRLGLIDVPGMPARIGGAKLRPDRALAGRFERGGFEHGQVLLHQFALGHKLNLERVHAVGVV